jgi:two-component system response regulator (stage 0 sporulation protein F)
VIDSVNRHVLIVDDQAGIRLLLQEVLEAEGLTVTVVADGLRAAAMLEEIRPDLILLDMKMPGMNGLELMRLIHDRGLQLNVMMMTAYAELEMMEQARQLGALGHFGKPFDIQDVARKVKQLLQGVNEN